MVHACVDGKVGKAIEDCGATRACFDGRCIPRIIGDALGTLDVSDPDDIRDPGPDLDGALEDVLAGDLAADLDTDLATDSQDVVADQEVGSDHVEEAETKPVPDVVALDSHESNSPDVAQADVGPPYDAEPEVEVTAVDAWAYDTGPETLLLDPGVLDNPTFGCGDGKVDPGEECDGPDLGGETCNSLGYLSGGILGCKQDCRFETILCGGPGSHSLAYAPVANLVKSEWVDVAYAPDGSYALLVGTDGTIAKYEPDKDLVKVGEIGCTGTRVAFAASGDAYVTGYSGTTGRLFKVPLGPLPPVEVPGASSAIYPYRAIEFDDTGTVAFIGGGSSTSSNPVLAVFSHHTHTGTTTLLKAKNVGQLYSVDLMYLPSEILAPYGPGVMAIPSLYTGWLLMLQNLDATEFSCGGCGNMGRAGWQPHGRLGIVAGTSSNALYVFSVPAFAWTRESCVAGLGAQSCWGSCGCGHANAVEWRPDGRRALILGAVWQSQAMVLEYRPKSAVWSATDLVKQPPVPFAGSGELVAAAFRPGTMCDEGLFVGGKNALYGIVVRFRDTDGHDCK